MRISDVLRRKGRSVATLPPDATVGELVTELKAHNVGAIVVSHGDGTVDGIVSERDVIRRLADDADLLDRPLHAIMTTQVHTCTASDRMDDVRALMTEQRIRHVPVVDDDGRLAGIISIGDAVKGHIDELQFERDELERYVAG